MTAPTGNPAASATPGAASGQAAGAGASAAPGTAGAQGSQDHPGSADYLGRVRGGGDFAESEVRKHQSRGDQAEATIRKHQEWMGSLNQYTGQLSGDDIVHHLTEWNDVLSDPRMKKTVDSWRVSRGRGVAIPDTSGGEVDDDEYLSDEQREIRALRGELAGLKNRLGVQELGAGQKALREHMEKIGRDLGMTQETFDRAQTALSKIVDAWNTPQAGEAGQKALANLRSPNGEKTVRGLLLAELSDQELLRLGSNADLRRREGLAGLATESPSGLASAGREAPPDFGGDFQKAAEWAELHPEGHDAR